MPSTAAKPGRQGPAQRVKLHRAVWRWHFYAGMLVVPVLVVASVTGGLYVFRAELEPLLYQSLMVVTPGTSEASVSYEEQFTAAEQAAGEASTLLFAVVPAAGEARGSRATLFRYKQPGGDQRYVFVDPHTGAVTGSIPRSHNAFDIILKLHRQLFAGTTGRVLVELTTSWAIVLTLTGVYLWWPKGAWRAAGVWAVRLNKGRYALLRDLHAIPAVALSAFTLAVLATGLFFSLGWGSGYRAAAFATGGLPEVFLSPPQSTPPSPDSPEVSTERISFDDAIAVAEARGYGDLRLTLAPPHDAKETFSVSVSHGAGRVLAGLLHLDQYSGEVLFEGDSTSSLPAMTTVLLYALPIHQGSVWGLPTKIAAFVVAVGLVFSSITGVWMWWIRRPAGTLGLPRRHDGVHLPWWVLASGAVLGVGLPAVGLSVLVIAVVEWLAARLLRSRQPPPSDPDPDNRRGE